MGNFSGVLFALVKPTPKTNEEPKDAEKSPTTPLKAQDGGTEETTLLKNNQEDGGSSLKKRIL